MSSKWTRIVGPSVCVLWVLLLTGHLEPVLSWADPKPKMAHGAYASEPQYLPWAAGRSADVSQGNGGDFSHGHPRTRYGWDFVLPLGEPVLSGVSGEVLTAGWGCDVLDSEECRGGWGNHVVVRVGDGTCARFAHLESVAVRPGQAVGVGTTLGTVGSSGHSTEPHLHYQRERCETGLALVSGFVEAGVPAPGMRATSGLPASS